MKLSSVHAERHVFDGAVNYEKPLRLELRFEGGAHLRLRGAGDGERMIVDGLPLEAPVEMEQYGRVYAFDVTGRLFPTLNGAAIDQLRSIDMASGKRVGLALCGADSEAFCFWIDGDQFYWGTPAALAAHPWLPGQVPVIGNEIEV